MNDFLDTDKASVPFWGFIAAIVILDLRQKADKKQLVEESPKVN